LKSIIIVFVWNQINKFLRALNSPPLEWPYLKRPTEKPKSNEICYDKVEKLKVHDG